MTWTPDELELFDATEEIVLVMSRQGKATRRIPVWMVVVDGQLFVRSYKGEGSLWFSRGRDEPAQAVEVGGRAFDVTFEVEPGILAPEIGAAYRAKYSRYGAGYLAPMEAAVAASATARLVKR